MVVIKHIRWISFNTVDVIVKKLSFFMQSSKLGYRTVEYLLDLLNLERAPIRILIKVSLDTRSTVSSTVVAILEVMYSYFQLRAKVGYFEA